MTDRDFAADLARVMERQKSATVGPFFVTDNNTEHTHAATLQRLAEQNAAAQEGHSAETVGENITDPASAAPTPSSHALLLNRLVQMQREPRYDSARDELLLAEHTIVQLEAENARLAERLKLYEAMLNECREEFCWHGNTGKHLSVDTYGARVDKIDAVLAREKEDGHGAE